MSFNYFISEAVFQYLVAAVDMVAEHGWKLLPEYRFDPASGLWRHMHGPVEPRLRLGQLRYDSHTGDLVVPQLGHDRAPEEALAGYLQEARARFDAASAATHRAPAAGRLSAEFEHLRWFELPAESLAG